MHLRLCVCACVTTCVLTQERERRSPPFNHLRMHPFSKGVSALQIYCMKEGVKVCHTANCPRGLSVNSSLTFTLLLLLQDVCIPDLIKLLDILGDNGVSVGPNTRGGFRGENISWGCFIFWAEPEERGAGGHHPGQHGAITSREGEC